MSPALRNACLIASAMPAVAAAHAQPLCASDGQPRPVSVLERFINADCDHCWVDAHTPVATAKELALDWIVPGSKGEDAPLSAAATRDGLDRLKALRRPVPKEADTVRTRASKPLRKMRVVQGLAFNDYIGASIEVRPSRGGPWKGWLLLVEMVPAGVEGSPVARNLVRGALRPDWPLTDKLTGENRLRLYESRPMRVPEGAKPERLRVVGLLEDSQGRLVAATMSHCVE